MTISEFDRLWQSGPTDALEAFFGKVFVYSRGEDSASITGQIVVQEIVEVSDRGERISSQSLAILVKAADYLIDGAVDAPARGDTFTDGDTVYTVMPRDKGRCYEPHDPDCVEILVYVKRTQ